MTDEGGGPPALTDDGGGPLALRDEGGGLRALTDDGGGPPALTDEGGGTWMPIEEDVPGEFSEADGLWLSFDENDELRKLAVEPSEPWLPAEDGVELWALSDEAGGL